MPYKSRFGEKDHHAGLRMTQFFKELAVRDSLRRSTLLPQFVVTILSSLESEECGTKSHPRSSR